MNPTAFARAEVVTTPAGDLTAITAAPYAAGAVVTLDETVTVAELADGSVQLANGRLTAILTPDGGLRSLIHHASGREASSGPGNRIVLYEDQPMAFEAWDIDPSALETAREAQDAGGATVVSSGPLRAEVRFERALGKASRMTQTVRLDAGSDLLQFHTVIDWKDRRTLVKAVFPIAARAMEATYETIYGAVGRPTHANTDADLAQYEVPGHRWADLSEPGFGVSLITDSRYGFSTYRDQMSVSLVRGPLSPDPTADIGEHHLAYALYPHAGDWRDADTTAVATAFNRPVLWTPGAPKPVLQTSLATSSAANVVIDTIKPAEDGDGWVARLYESTGARCEARLTFGAPITEAWFSNTLEDRLEPLTVEDGGLRLSLRGFQIATLRLR